MLQPLFYKEGDDNYEDLFPIKSVLAVILCVVLFNIPMLWVSTYFSDKTGSTGKVEEQLNTAQSNNREAREISTDVRTGIESAGRDLHEASVIIGSSTTAIAEIRTGLQHIHSEVKKTRDNTAGAGALVEESLSILQEVEEQSTTL